MNNDDSSNDEETIIVVELAKQKTRQFPETTDFDVIVVGAGCASVGTALMLTRTFGLDAE
jgi:ribulose 1,5-bisphosphate synthetase/thiazole synthase